MTKRILVALLTVFMLIGMMTTAAFAADGGDVAAIGQTQYPTLEAAIAAVQNGDTITMLSDSAESVTIKQAKDVSFIIDGDGHTYTGTITVDGSRRSTGKETLTIRNVNFVANTSGQSSISAVKNTYVHNITVDNCTFTGTGSAVMSCYGIYLRHSYNITVKNTTGSNLYDLVYANTAVTGFTAENVTVTDSGMGFMLPYGMDLTFKDVDLDVSGAGIGIYNYNSSTATFDNCTINAEPAVWLEQKNNSKQYSLIFNGTNHFTGKSENGEWLTVKGTDAKFTVVVNDTGLDMDKTSGLVANVGNEYYNICPGHNFEGDKCTVCGESYHKYAGHDVVATLGKPATCTEGGLTDGTFCNTCMKVDEPQREIPATGHNYENGVCTVCGQITRIERGNNWLLALVLLRKFDITATATEGGEITFEGDFATTDEGYAKVRFKQDITYTITPDEGYMISDVLVDGESIGAVSEYTFENVGKKHTISVIFTEIPAEESSDEE